MTFLIYNEIHQHTALNTLPYGFLGIFQIYVNPFLQELSRVAAAQESGFYITIVIRNHAPLALEIEFLRRFRGVELRLCAAGQGDCKVVQVLHFHLHPVIFQNGGRIPFAVVFRIHSGSKHHRRNPGVIEDTVIRRTGFCRNQFGLHRLQSVGQEGYRTVHVGIGSCISVESCGTGAEHVELHHCVNLVRSGERTVQEIPGAGPVFKGGTRSKQDN